MGKVHNGGFTASTGFKRTSNSPIDDSTIVEFLTDLTDGVTLVKPYRLMIVSVLETNKPYQWNGQDISNINNWKLLGNEKSSALNSDTEETVATSRAVKLLKDLIDGLTIILQADDADLDTAQERLNRIKELTSDLDNLTIEDVQNLTTELDNLQDAIDLVNLNKLDAGQFQGNADDIVSLIVRQLIIKDENGIELFRNALGDGLKIEDLDFNDATKVISAKNKQNKFDGGFNRIPKSITDNELQDSRIEDTGDSLGIGTTYYPTKDITLGNNSDKEIGVEESDANTKGRNLIISAGRSTDYRINSVFNSFSIASVGVKSMAISPTTNDFYVLGTDNTLYKQTNSQGNFVSTGNSFESARRIHISANNDLFITKQTFTQPNGLLKQTNCQGDFNQIYSAVYMDVITTRDNNNKIIAKNGISNQVAISDTNQENFNDIGFSSAINNSAVGLTYHNNGSIYYALSKNGVNEIYVKENEQSNFELINSPNLSYTDIVATNNGNVYLSTVEGIYERVGGQGSFAKIEDVDRIYSSITRNPTNGNVYASVGSTIYELSFSAKGTDNLDGGTLKQVAGTGKGEGKSRIEGYTGVKQPSGTNMQPLALRYYIDENGWFIYNYPEFADNASAVSAGMPNNALYKDPNGNVKSVIIIPED
jgi:hypothetical protein